VTFNTGTGLIDNANAGQSISIDNSLGGAGGIQLNGNSTLTLTTINTYTGATTINPGATLALSGLGGIPFQASSPPMVRSIFPVRQFPSRRSARWPAAAWSSSVTTAW
jgi:autotransporter-associated beta strand protein